MGIARIINHILRPNGKAAFLKGIPYGTKILDVGCGNDSPYAAKMQRPDLYYVGIDIGDYNQEHPPALYADEYITTSPDNFSAEIDKLRNQMGAVISSHNLEHCSNQERTLQAVLSALRPGGRLYLSFPCEESKGFPSRAGCLNFYDDPTHKTVPSFEKVMAQIASAGLTVDYCQRRYRPRTGVLVGLLLEPLSVFRRKVMPGTWALYGFETVIWAKKGQGVLSG